MAKCQVCGKEYHACSACGLDYDWQYNNCSHACWRKSKEYSDAKTAILIAKIKLKCPYEGLLFDEEVLEDLIDLRDG